MKNKKWLFIITVIVLIVFISSVFILNNDTDWSENKKVNNEVNNIESKKKVYKHINPERISKNDSFKWKFVLNDIASVYPRREALVKDILVDIWDTVKAGDTLATLFEPWIIWESDSKINIKNTLLSTKYNLLSEIEIVKEAKISEADIKIEEKNIIITETINNFDSKIKALEKRIKDSNLIENPDYITSQSEKISNSKKNIDQKLDVLNIKLDEIFYDIRPMFYIWNIEDIDYLNIKSWDLSDLFWAKNSSIKTDLLYKVTLFQRETDNLSVLDKYSKITEINNSLIETLKNTITSVSIKESDISTYIVTLKSHNKSLLTLRDNYEDSVDMYNILLKSEKENFENLNLELDKLKSDKSLQIEKLKADLNVFKGSKDILIANEDKSITNIKNDILIARSNLDNEYLKSWDYKITSPFSWIISKRNLQIWEKITSNIEAFRITWVNTTLSRITKKEVKFFVPENLKNNLEINKIVSFSTWDKNSKNFTWVIYRISPEIDENNFSITVQAKVEDSISLPNNYTVRVNLETQVSIFKIPTTSIYNKNDRKIVYYKKENWKFGVRDITIISDDGEFSLVTGDFDETLQIVTTPIFIK